jgi:deoxyhypusine synthase
VTKVRDQTRYGAGHEDDLSPLTPLDLSALDSVDALVRAMSHTAFGGRCLGEAADVLEAMVRDEELYEKGYNRVYDTIELEKNLDDVELILERALADLPDGTVLCSRAVCEQLGRQLALDGQRRGVLQSAFSHGVPVYVPAFTDSELGLDLAIYNQLRSVEGKPPVSFDPFLDLHDFTNHIREHETLGIFTIGGGVPRNWAQQVGPYLEILQARLGGDAPPRRYKYAVRICPEPVHWGGLSGCSYTEGVSWGKFVPEQDGGRFAEVFADATIAWPLVVRSVMERMDRA